MLAQQVMWIVFSSCIVHSCWVMKLNFVRFYKNVSYRKWHSLDPFKISNVFKFFFVLMFVSNTFWLSFFLLTIWYLNLQQINIRTLTKVRAFVNIALGNCVFKWSNMSSFLFHIRFVSALLDFTTVFCNNCYTVWFSDWLQIALLQKECQL